MKLTSQSASLSGSVYRKGTPTLNRKQEHGLFAAESVTKQTNEEENVKIIAMDPPTEHVTERSENGTVQLGKVPFTNYAHVTGRSTRINYKPITREEKMSRPKTRTRFTERTLPSRRRKYTGSWEGKIKKGTWNQFGRAVDSGENSYEPEIRKMKTTKEKELRTKKKIKTRQSA